ncbi:RNA polymerase I termination factor-like [Macadamia integrifolia]|uniref:RNA polymerase I termination factor-like n=1 Tax=Macadamia integrifolia TaxID=60698 RepID=UPI001C501F0C|nr:RNA polymerase I termination factor-like [Macadamia integrifolia]
MGGRGTGEDEGDILQKRKMGKSRRNDKNVNGSVEKTTDSRGVTDRRVEDLNLEFRKVEKKKKSSKEKEKGSIDLDISNLVKEVPVGDNDHVGDKNKEGKEKKKKKKKRKMEPEKNIGCWEDDIELKPTKNIKKLSGNKMENDGECCDDMAYDVKTKEPPNVYYPVSAEKSVGSLEVHKNEGVSINATDSGLIKIESRKRKKDKRNKDKEKISSSLVNDRKMQKDNATIDCKSAGKEKSSDSAEVERGQQREKKKKQKIYDKMDKDDGGIKSLKMKSSDKVLIEDERGTAIGRENLEDKECVGEGRSKSQGHAVSHTKKQKVRNKEAFSVEVKKNNDQNRKKKAKSVKDVLVEKADKGDRRRKRTSQGGDHSPNSKILEPSKRVRFSGHVEVFPSPDATDLVEEDQKRDLVQGKRFSREEDEMIKTAVSNYIEEHGLGEDGLNRILRCKSEPGLHGCWKEIAAALPWRTHQSVYYRGHVLFERDDAHKWTAEEYELVRRVHEKHGSKWRMVADVLGKHRFHVKDAWRRIKLANQKRGHWSQEEYQTLFDLVNMDLRMKAFGEKKSKHGMLRDNISWGAISDKLSTRINSSCCEKWYGQLTSPMVAEGLWQDSDDYRLLIALYDLDASCIEDVDWDNLLDLRSGDVCRKRWNQMVSHIGKHGCNSFAEQVEVLSKRYCPELLEVREAYDSRPVTP